MDFRFRLQIFGSLLISLANIPTVHAREMDDLLDMDLTTLMQVEVNLVSRTPQTQFDSAAAVYVINREQIARSGFKTIPDLLRLAPGIQVGKIDGNTWSIDIRNNPSRFSSNLLVLMDGRTLYNPLFGGVNWDVQNTFMPDIERIEIIRGPGGTLWGANAVNGIINIVTRRADATLGGEVQALAGRGDIEYDAGARYGSKLGKNLYARAYAKTRGLDNGEFLGPSASNNNLFPPGNIANDDAALNQAGFRSDWIETGQTATLQADYYDGTSRDVNSTVTSLPGNSRTNVSGGNLLGRWTRAFSGDGSLSVQFFYDHTRRKDETFRESHDIFDLDVQHSFAVTRQQITWGAGYRHLRDDTRNTPPGAFALSPEERNDNLYTAFIQTRIDVIPATLQLTLGNKFEHNDYSGYENQPSARALWRVTRNHNAWAAVTRAVRTPTRADTDAILDFGGFVIPIGDPDFKAQPMLSREVGYRGLWNSWMSVDLSAYWNRYSHVSTSTREIWGFELNPRITLSEHWSLETWYAYARGRRKQSDGSQTGQNLIPNHTAGLSSLWQPHADWEADVNVRYVDSVSSTSPEFDAYTRVDLRLGWQANRQLKLDAGLSNLLDSRHEEAFDSTKVNTGVRRGGYVQINYRFD